MNPALVAVVKSLKSVVQRMRKFSLFPLLSVLFIALFIYLAFDPVDRRVWVIENIPVVGVFLLLALTYKKFQFSNFTYSMLFIWLFLHTIGGHFTFANVPFDYVTEFFGFERNNFDRLAHFSVGFYAVGITELLLRKGWSIKWVAYAFGFSFVMSVAAIYEIIEWIYAVVDGGEVGVEFLGSQGDIWDAQKDMLLDGLGAIFSLLLFTFLQKRQACYEDD